MSFKDDYPLLSCADIEELPAHFLPRRDVTDAEVILQLEERHRQRQKAIESHSHCHNLMHNISWVSPTFHFETVFIDINST